MLLVAESPFIFCDLQKKTSVIEHGYLLKLLRGGHYVEVFFVKW